MLVLLCLLSLLQRDTFYDLYDKGKQLLDNEAYAEAAATLEKAVAIRPESDPSARTYSMRTKIYHPYVYLAEAYFWQGQPEKVNEYLALSKKYKEQTFVDARLAQRLTAMNRLVQAQLVATVDTATETSDPVQALTPLLNALLREDFPSAEDELDILIEAYPDVTTLAGLKESLRDLVDAREQERQALDAFNTQLTESLQSARFALQAGNDKEALSFYQQVLALDPQNQEAQVQETRLWGRLRATWNEEGRNDEEITRLESQLEQQATQSKEESRRLRAQVDHYKREAEKAGENFNELLAGQQEAPEPKLVWFVQNFNDRNFWGEGSYYRTIRFSLEHVVGLDKIQLFREADKRLIQEWNPNGAKKFAGPEVTRYQFPTVNAGIYLVVRDSDGHAVRIDNPYTFPRPKKPFYMESWFRGTLMTLICGLVAGFFFFKKWRMRKAFRQRFNPYIAGAPVLNDSMFYGRHMTLKQILNALHNNSLMIYGERRIGKTSFLHRLNKELPQLVDPEYQFFPVFIDLQGVKEVEFFHTLEQEIALCLEPLGIIQDAAPNPLDSRQFISRLRKYIRALKDQCTKKPKLVLLLDEVDVMNGFSEHTNQQLRSVFMKGFADHIVAVMAGIHINTRWKSEGSPWYNFFEQIELRPFRKNQADDLIKNPVEGVYSYSTEAVDRIMEITNGKPYLIQKMCLNLISHILAENKRKVTKQDVEYVFKGIGKEFYGASGDE